ncbi:MAG: hypothetical protein ACOY45_13005 [Pseudomonadota bacterium]
MMLFKHFTPMRAYHDLRGYLVRRSRRDFLFMLLSLTVTALILWGFFRDSQVEVPYKRTIIYVESWPLDRSDDQIRAQQKIDMADKAKKDAELEARREKRRQEFKKVDDWLSDHGI